MGRREGRREEDHPGARHHPRGDHERGGERRQGPDQLAAVEGRKQRQRGYTVQI